MAHILATCFQKGGVGKTTTALNIGANLARRGHRVLMVDMDPQGNLTQGFGFDLVDIDQGDTVYEFLLDPKAALKTLPIAIEGAGEAGLDLIPATLRFAGAELSMANAIAKEQKLRTALAWVAAAYDYIIIDTPPALGFFTINALAAATAVILPVQVHPYAYMSIDAALSTVEMVKQINPTLHVGGIVCTMSDKRTVASRSIEQKIRENHGALAFTTTIPLTTRLVEAPATGEAISDYAPDSAAAVAYEALTEEVITRYGK